MIEAVIFDVDGTLVDLVDQHAHAWVFDLVTAFPLPSRGAQPRSNGGIS